MSFVDKVLINIIAGDGGNGRTSFRQEKFIDRGGPDGGDGGNGGDILFHASRNQNTLAAFRYQKELKAQAGGPGDKQRKHGKSAESHKVEVPVGTVISNEAGEILADLTEDDQTAVIAKGGRGGFGNAHFVSSRRQAPNFSEKGEPGENLAVQLELKVIADVGLIGLPNAGKSTLLSRISNARPEIADYPFTTLTPNLGVVDVDKGTSLLFADIPGLIEGASKGKGLGHEFLRHIERTAVLVHLIDAYQDDIAKAYKTVQKELSAYTVDLTDRPQIVVINKVEGLDPKAITKLIAKIRKIAPKSINIFAISAQSGQGLSELLYSVKDTVAAERTKKLEEQGDEELPVIKLPESEKTWRVTKQGDYFLISGHKIEKFAARTDFENEHGLERLRDIMRKMGIMHELKRQGIKADQRIVIANGGEFIY